MTGIYVFAGIIVVGIVAFIYFKLKWRKADRTAETKRAGLIEDDRLKEEERVKGKKQA